MAFCIPLICGFPTKIDQDAPAPGRACPRCHNASVVSASSRTWFEFFWIPLIPFTKHRIWVCGICQWQMNQGDGPDPQPPQPQGFGGMGGFQGQGQGQYAGNPPPPNQGWR